MAHSASTMQHPRFDMAYSIQTEAPGAVSRCRLGLAVSLLWLAMTCMQTLQAAQVPDWFKLSLFDLRDDLAETAENGKKGLILYFGQDGCGFCEKQLKVNWGNPEIVAYTRKNFEVVAIDIRGNQEITDLKGQKHAESKFAHLNKFHFTPTIVFIDLTGREVFRLPGYRSEYQFKAVLEYVANEEYKTQSFRNYLERGHLAEAAGSEVLNKNALFARGPFIFARNKEPAKQKLLVSFEKPKCHACDVMHGDVLSDETIIALLKKLQAAQIDITKDESVITPGGHSLKMHEWVKLLNIDYTPNLVFFDEKGMEIIRMDSTSSVHRMSGILQYVLSNDYLKYPTFQAWRQQQRLDAVKKK